MDYRTFLGQYYHWKKASDDRFSYRYFSKQAKLQSPNYLKYIVDGKRHLSYRFFDNVTNALRLSQKEIAYFRSLWEYNIANEPAKKCELYLNVCRARESTDAVLLEEAKLDFIRDLSNPILREFFLVHPGIKDYEKIARAVSLSVPEVKRAIRRLVALEMVVEHPTGFHPTDHLVKVDDDLRSSLIWEAHRKALRNTLAKIDDLAVEEREFGILLAALNSRNLAKFKKLIRDFLVEANVAAEAETGRDVIYQLSVQLIPVTKRIEP